MLTFSCVSGQQKKSGEFINSKIYQNVKCEADTTISYALFLPPHYQRGNPCPILILFDSHGDGLLPVNLFSDEAAKSGFIIAGSNNSKNGLPTTQTTDIYRKTIADISTRFDVEKRALYVGGFSGGSRVAGAVAITEAGIAGVVGCGAGLPNMDQKPVNDFSYLAVVGNQDFNFTEMQQLNASLDQAGFQHHLLVFDGIHQWPPKELIPDIFAWLRFDAMRHNSIPQERAEINLFIEKNDRIASVFETQGKFHLQQETYVKMLHFLQGLTDVTPLQAEIKRLSAEKEVVEYDKKQNDLLLLEQNLQQKYLPQLANQSIEWWTLETAKLRSLSEDQENLATSRVYKRLLGSLSMTSYLYSSNALKQPDLAVADRYIKIYSLVDPGNAEHRYMAAKVEAKKNNPEGVFIALKQAFELGFKDIGRLKADKDFSSYMQDERFKILLKNK